MFRSFIYLDQEKMYSYLRQIDADYANQPVELSKKKTRGGSFGTDFLGVNAGIEIEEYANKMFFAGSNLRNKSEEADTERHYF